MPSELPAGHPEVTRCARNFIRNIEIIQCNYHAATYFCLNQRSVFQTCLFRGHDAENEDNPLRVQQA
jgi:hypothetical protein